MPIEWQAATIQTTTCTTFYRRTGGAKPPVVLLHGLSDNGACWSRLAHDLADTYDLIMPDARGHGQSSVPATDYSSEARAADVLALLEGLGLDRPVLIGHSMGGLTAALVGAMAPERVSGIMLEDPAFIPPDEWDVPLHKTWPLEHALDRERSIAELIALGQPANPRWHAEIFPFWAQAKREASLRVFDWFALPPDDGDALVAALTVPTLLVTGDPALDAIITPARAAQMQARNTLVRVAHLPGVGHCIRYEQPAAFAALARDFLATCFG